MVQVAYPPNFPMEEIQDCIRIVTANTILEEKELFGASLWNVWGFGQGMLLGPPDRLPQMGPDDQQQFASLRAALMTVDPAGDAPQALPALLVLLVEMLVQLVTELLGG